MDTDPSSLFLAASLATGLVEGASVVGYLNSRLRAANDSGAAAVENDAAKRSVPSLPVCAAYSILYGAASVPLGAIGASPGYAFLPRCFAPTAKTGASDDTANSTEDGKRLGSSDELSSAPVDTPVVGTGRGVGRMLRQENSRKMVHHKRRQQLNARYAQNEIAGSGRASAYSSVSSRYIATLDGCPLPTRLAEAMRRSRCLLVSAGMVSYAITRYLSDKCNASGRHLHEANDNRTDMKNKKILGGTDLLKSASTQQDAESPFSPNIQTSFVDGVYHAREWIYAQLERGGPGKLVRDWAAANTSTQTVNASSSEIEPITEDQSIADTADGGEPSPEADDGVHSNATTKSSTTPEGSSDNQPPTQSSSKVWRAAVTSVDVLGKSIRHLFVSPYRVASAVASVGQRRPDENKEEEEEEKAVGPGEGDL